MMIGHRLSGILAQPRGTPPHPPPESTMLLRGHRFPGRLAQPRGGPQDHRFPGRLAQPRGRPEITLLMRGHRFPGILAAALDSDFRHVSDLHACSRCNFIIRMVFVCISQNEMTFMYESIRT